MKQGTSGRKGLLAVLAAAGAGAAAVAGYLLTKKKKRESTTDTDVIEDVILQTPGEAPEGKGEMTSQETSEDDVPAGEDPEAEGEETPK